MFDLNEFLLELDHMYATNPKGVEAYLKSGLEEAGKCLDGPAMLTILNELMGYYRVMSKPEECEWCIEKAVRIAEKLGIQGTTDYATMLLNIGTAQRVMGRWIRQNLIMKKPMRYLRKSYMNRIIGWRHYITIEVFCMQIPAALRKQKRICRWRWG